MKFCYVDESGTGDEPFAVMVGVLVDAYRMRPTKAEWDELLARLSGIVKRPVKEFHTKDFYAGNSPWRGLKGQDRADVLSAIFEWYAERKHHIVYTAIDKAKHKTLLEEKHFSESVSSLWQTLALHLALAVQKNNQKHKKNKGNTVLIFDAHDKDEKPFSELILNPPDWTDSYYSRGKKRNRLDQIVDVPHFVDSEHVGMIQLADCISYFLRRHIEIEEDAVSAKYDGEETMVGEWAELALQQGIPRSAIYPRKGRCEAAEFFYRLAPSTLLD